MGTISSENEVGVIVSCHNYMREKRARNIRVNQIHLTPKSNQIASCRRRRMVLFVSSSGHFSHYRCIECHQFIHFCLQTVCCRKSEPKDGRSMLPIPASTYLEYGLFMRAISRATVAHSSSLFRGRLFFFCWSSSHFRSSYLWVLLVLISIFAAWHFCLHKS